MVGFRVGVELLVCATLTCVTDGALGCVASTLGSTGTAGEPLLQPEFTAITRNRIACAINRILTDLFMGAIIYQRLNSGRKGSGWSLLLCFAAGGNLLDIWQQIFRELLAARGAQMYCAVGELIAWNDVPGV